MKCKDCGFWYEWTHKKDKGDCRKNAPVVAGTSEEWYACWPDTNSYDFCGESKPKNTE